MTKTLMAAPERPDGEDRVIPDIPPVESIRKSPFKLRDSESDETNDGFTLDGYGAVFNSLTTIDSWEGRFREQIAPGAMKKSFRENPPIVQFDHGRHSDLGSFPIAKLEPGYPREEVDPELAPEGGAHVVARMFKDPRLGLLREAITAGAINGMSFRFSVVRESWTFADGKAIRDEQQLRDELRRTRYEDVPDAELPIRTLKELRVPEIGPVVWPAYTETSVGMRSRVIDFGRLADGDPEQLDLLGRAMFIANTTRNHDDEPQATELPAGAHSLDSSDAPQSTGKTPAGEHPSNPVGRRGIDVTLRAVRDMCRDIESRGTNR